MVMTKLYHGTSNENALSILNTGFNFKLSGSNWGNTYGNGIYFTPNYDTARFYAGEEGIVLSVTINVNGYQLKRDISPNNKKKIKLPNDSDYNCIISPNKDEYLILNF